MQKIQLKAYIPTSRGYSKHRQVSTDVQESLMATYLQQSAERHFGLSVTEARHMAYQCAVKYEINDPPSWHENKYAATQCDVTK